MNLQTLRQISRSVISPRRGRISYVGWAGHDNLGDEALFEAIEMLLPDHALYPHSLKARRPVAWWAADAIRKTRTCCLGGGTLIFSGNRNLRSLRSALHRGLPVFSMGAGVVDRAWGEPSERYEARRAEWLDVLGQFRGVAIRGPISKVTLESRGFTAAEVTGDPALVFSQEARGAAVRDRLLGVNVGTAGKNVWGGEASESALVDTLADATARLMRRGWDCRIFSVWPADDAVCEALAERLGLAGDAVQRHYRDARAFMRSAGECCVFTGMKLHSVVLACCANVPPVMLEYRTKCRDFMASMELDAYDVRIDHVQPDQLAALIEQARDRRAALADQLTGLCNEYSGKLEAYSMKVLEGIHANRR